VTDPEIPSLNVRVNVSHGMISELFFALDCSGKLRRDELCRVAFCTQHGKEQFKTLHAVDLMRSISWGWPLTRVSPACGQTFRNLVPSVWNPNGQLRRDWMSGMSSVVLCARANLMHVSGSKLCIEQPLCRDQEIYSIRLWTRTRLDWS